MTFDVSPSSLFPLFTLLTTITNNGTRNQQSTCQHIRIPQSESLNTRNYYWPLPNNPVFAYFPFHSPPPKPTNQLIMSYLLPTTLHSPSPSPTDQPYLPLTPSPTVPPSPPSVFTPPPSCLNAWLGTSLSDRGRAARIGVTCLAGTLIDDPACTPPRTLGGPNTPLVWKACPAGWSGTTTAVGREEGVVCCPR